MKTASIRLLHRCIAAALALASTWPVIAAEDAASVIARARQYLGTDEALDAVHALHFLGKVTADDGKTHQLEIIMRRPMQQLMIETTDEVRVLTALDDYAMWRRMDPIDRPGTGRVALMSAQAVRATRANVGQTLFYYRGLETIGGTVSIEGEEEVDGITCVKAIFSHPGDIRYIRFFDKATGRLVVTRSDQGAETRETGEMVVAGIRFPQGLTTMIDGKTSQVTFDEIRVNEEFADEMFKVPMPKFDFGSSPTSPSSPDPTPTDPGVIPTEPNPLPVEPNPLPTDPAPAPAEPPPAPPSTP